MSRQWQLAARFKPVVETDTGTDGIAQNPDFTPVPFFSPAPSHQPKTVKVDDGAGGFTIINASDFDAATMTVHGIGK